MSRAVPPRILVLLLALFAAAAPSPAGAAHGGPHLLWDAPQTSADGSNLTDLAKYHVYRRPTSPCPAPATPGPPPGATRIGEVLAPAPDPAAGATAGFDVPPAQSGTFACVTAVDTTGNEGVPSNTIVVPDMGAPAVALTAPTAGATVSGIITITATATDNVGVAGVQFRIDGNLAGAERTVAPYTFAWNTAQAVNGPHTLTATARDAAANTTVSATVTVTVANAPVVPAAPGNLRLQ